MELSKQKPAKAAPAEIKFGTDLDPNRGGKFTRDEIPSDYSPKAGDLFRVTVRGNIAPATVISDDPAMIEGLTGTHANRTPENVWIQRKHIAELAQHADGIVSFTIAGSGLVSRGIPLNRFPVVRIGEAHAKGSALPVVPKFDATMTKAETGGNRREEWERKLRRIDAQTENLHAMNEKLHALNEREMRASRWFPFVVTLGIFAFAYVLAKYF